MLAELRERTTDVSSITSTRDVMPLDDAEIARLSHQFREPSTTCVVVASDFTIAESRGGVIQQYPRQLRILNAVEMIDEPIITSDSAKSDAEFIEQIRDSHPARQLDFVPLPERSR